MVLIALLAGIAYAFVAIPSQTQLQEDIPEDVRGRVFGVLNMLVSVASFLPIIIVGPLSDLVGTTSVLLVVAVAITVSGILSIVTRGPLKPAEATGNRARPRTAAGLDPVAVAIASEIEAGEGAPVAPAPTAAGGAARRPAASAPGPAPPDAARRHGSAAATDRARSGDHARGR